MPKDVADVLAKLAFKEQQAEAADRSKQKNEEKQKRDRDRNRLSLQNKKTEEADRTQYKPLVPYSPAPTPTAFGAENIDDYTSWSLDHLQSERDRINGTIAQNEVQIARTIDPVARQKLIDDTDALRGTVDSLEKQIHVRRPASVVSEEATAASEKKKRGVWDAIMGALNSHTQAELAAASSLTGKKEKAEGYANTAQSEMERSIAGSAAHREGRAEEKALNAELLDAREGNHLTTNERYEKTTRYRELSQSVVARMFNADELSDEEKKQLEADTAELKQLQSELGSDYLNGIERVGAGIQGALLGIEKGLASDVAWLGEKAPQMAGNILFQGGGPMGDIAGILLQAGAPYLRKFAGIMSEKQQDIQKLAEKNATSGEKTSYSAVQSGTEMAFDTAMAALTGVGGLTFMGLRVFGGSSEDALEAGASEARAIAYGATHAGIEVLSEKMFDVMGIYGGGYGDDLAKNVIARTTKNPALAKLMVIAFAGIEEPIEEVASGIADPAAEFWINGEKLTAENLLSKYDAEWAGEIGEAMLVANILGTLGGTVEVTRNGIQSRNGNALEIGSEEWRQEIMSPKVRKSLEDAGIDIGEVEEAIAEAQQALVDRVVEIETQETHGPRGHSESTHTEEGRTPTQQALHDMDISDGATSANVAEILSSPELKAEFEQIAGVKIEGTPEQQAQIIQDNAQKVGEYVGYKYAESPVAETLVSTVNNGAEVRGAVGDDVVSALTGTEAQPIIETPATQRPVQTGLTQVQKDLIKALGWGADSSADEIAWFDEQKAEFEQLTGIPLDGSYEENVETIKENWGVLEDALNNLQEQAGGYNGKQAGQQEAAGATVPETDSGTLQDTGITSVENTSRAVSEHSRITQEIAQNGSFVVDGVTYDFKNSKGEAVGNVIQDESRVNELNEFTRKVAGSLVDGGSVRYVFLDGKFRDVGANKEGYGILFPQEDGTTVILCGADVGTIVHESTHAAQHYIWNKYGFQKYDDFMGEVLQGRPTFRRGEYVDGALTVDRIKEAYGFLGEKGYKTQSSLEDYMEIMAFMVEHDTFFTDDEISVLLNNLTDREIQKRTLGEETDAFDALAAASRAGAEAISQGYEASLSEESAEKRDRRLLEQRGNADAVISSLAGIETPATERQNVPEALVPETEEQTEQPAEETPAEETPTEEAPTEEAEPKPEEQPEKPKKQTPKEKVRDILQKGDKITDADMAYILGHDSAYEALRDYGIDPDRELVGSDRQRKAALRGLAADLLNNGELPSVEAVQQLKEENQHRSTEHLFLDEIHRLDEQIEAARLQGDTERVNDLTARKENYSKKLDATREILNKYKQQQKAKKEAAKVKEISGKISDIVNKLTTASSNPSEGNYVPKGARTIVTDAISLITRSQSDSAAAASQARRAEIAEKIQNAKTLKEAEKLLGQWSRISNSEMRQQAKFSRILDAVEELKSSKYYENDLMGAEVLQDKLATISESLGDTPFYEMDSEQLGQVYDAVKAINNYVRNAVRTRIAGENRVAYEVEQEMRQEVVKARTAAKNSVASVIRDANMGFLNSKNVFNLLGGRHADSMFNKFQNSLNEAQKRQNAMLLDGMDKIMPLVNDNKNFKTRSKKVTVEGFVDENGKKIPMTRSTMMYLDMLLDMEDGARSVSYAGIDFPGLFGFLHDIDSRGWGSSHKRMGGIAGEVATLQHEWKTLTKDLNTELKKSNKDDAWKQRVTQMTEQLDDLETRIDVARKEAGIDTATLKANLDAELTDYEKQMLAAMREGFDFARERINDMMEDVFGFSGANVENYVPMYRDPNFRKVSLDTFKADVASEQWGNMKKRVEFASQPLRAMDIYEVYQSYMKKASVYAEVMPAVRNFMKVWNTTEATDTESGQIESLRNSIRDKFGEKPIKYIEGLLQAIQGGGQTVDDISFIPKLIAKTRGNLAKASLRVGNIGVQWSQLASLASGSKYIPLRYIAKAAVSTEQKSTREFINQYSAYLRDRMANNSVFRAETQTIDDMIDRADWLSGGIQRNDLNAVTTLWKAAEYMVESEEGLTRGDPGFGERVAEVWEKTLDDTQPMWSPMQRPANLRSPSEIVKAFMMFKTQPMQHYNMLYEATANLEQANADLNAVKKGGDAEAIEQAKAGLKERQSEAGRTYAAVALANATYTILRTVADGLIHKWDKFRDKETGEVTAEQIGKRMAWLLGETTAGCVPFGDILFGVLETAVTGEYYFGISLAGIDNINTALTKTTDLLKSIGEVELSDEEISAAKKEKLKKNAYASAKAIGEAFGLSINNVEKLVKGAEQWVGDIKTIIDNDVTLSEIWHGDYRGEYYDFSASQNKNQAIDALLDGNDKKFDRIMRRMEEGHDEGYAEQQVAAAIKESYSAEDVDYSTAKNMLVRTGYTDAEADKTILGWHTDGIYDDSRSDWEKSREDREDTDLDLDLDRARGMEGFADLNADSQKEVLDDVYNYYKHLENKEYAEANGIGYENEKYEKYEDLDDPVARMVLEQTLNPAIKKDKKDPSEIANPDVVDALVGKYIAGDMSDEDKAWFEEQDYAKDLIAGAQLDKPIDADTYFDILDFVQDLSKDTSKMKDEGIDERDYKAIDETIKALAPILDSDEAIDIFRDSYTWTDELIDAAAIGMGSETFYKYFDQYNKMNNDKTLAPKKVYDDMYRIVEDADDLTGEQKEFLHDRLGVYQQLRMGDTTFEKFVDKGMPTDYAEKYLSIWADEKAKLNANLKPGEKEKDLSDTDKLRVIWRDDSIEDDHVKFDYIFATHYAPKQHTLALWLNTSLVQGKISRKDVDDYWNKFSLEYDWHRSWDYAKDHG